MDQVDLPSNPNLKVRSKVIQKDSDDFGRKRWEVEHYEELVVPVEQAVDARDEKYLIARTQKLNLETNHRKDGFYCQVCNQLYKCDIAYLTHINSQAHNRKLGMSLKVEGSSVSDVKSKLAHLAKAQPLSKIKQKINQKKARMESIIKAQLQNAIKTHAKEQSHDSDNQSQESSDSQNDIDDHQAQHKETQNLPLPEPQPIPTSTQPTPLQQPPKPQQPQQDPQQALMRAMGLPTSFKSKKR